MTLLKEQERLGREIGDKERLLDSLGMQAIIHRERGNLEGAVALQREVERFCREVGNKRQIQEEERLCRELRNTEWLATSLANQAGLLSGKLDRPQEAVPLAVEANRLALDVLHQT